MNRLTRLRRTGILCLHCLQNAAYYRAWVAAPVAKRQEQFWIALNGNFIDMCLLERCKLFGDLKAKHHWSKVITEQANFLAGLYQKCGLNEQTLEAYRLEVRAYRDKYVAHLDEGNNFVVPNLQHAIDTSRYLYDYLVAHEDDVDAFHDGPMKANTRYQAHLQEGRAAHRA